MERAVLPSGFGHGYTFHEDQDGVSIRIDCGSPDIEFDYSKEENSVFIGADGLVFLCGKFAGDVEAVEHEVMDELITIKVKKSGKWPVVISEPSAKGIDAKSEFLLGMLSETRNEIAKAWNHFVRAAGAGFFQAKKMVADAYANPGNKYGVGRNLEESVKMYASLYEETRLPELAIKGAEALCEQERYEEASKLLEGCSTAEAKLRLGSLLSPIFGKLNEPERAVALFEELAQGGNAAAMRQLAKHLEEGCGVKASLVKARDWIVRAHAIDGKEPATIDVPESVEAQENEEAQASEEAEKAPETQETEEAKETQETEEAKETQETQETEEAKETQETEEAKETQETEEAKETPQTQAAEEAKETPETQETEEAEKASETQETEEAKETQETQETEEAKETPQTQAAEEAEKAPETQAAEEAKETPQTQENEEAEKAPETQAAEEAPKAPKAQEAKESLGLGSRIWVGVAVAAGIMAVGLGAYALWRRRK